MFEKFAHKGICCDSMHGTNPYDFSLTTVLVIDKFGQGFPVAWCLSSQEDYTTMTIFFNEIKNNCGVVKSVFFMSNMAPQFYNAWVAVMGDPRPKKLVCTWHVNKAWKEELRKKIGDITIEADVYKLLRIVLQHQNENMFHDCLEALLLYYFMRSLHLLNCRIKGMLLQMMDEVDQCTSSTALKPLEKQMRAAHSLFPSLKDKKEQQVILLKINVDAPANKNMETQPRFYCTKK